MIPVIDLHADTYMRKNIFNTMPWIREAYFKADKNSAPTVQFTEDVTKENIIAGNVRLQTQSLYIDELLIRNPLHGGLKMLANIKRDIEQDKDLYQYYDINDFQTKPHKYGTLVSIEGLELLNNDLDLLDLFYELGVRMVAPTWNRALPYVGSVVQSYGVQELGVELAKKINKLGMIFDVSHMSDQGFWDYLDLIETPIIASHSNFREINPHSRNLNREQIKAISDRGGVMGINFYPGFLAKSSEIDCPHFFPHGFYTLYNMIESITTIFGDDIVAFGSDFDGISIYPEGVRNPSFYPYFAEFLRSKSVSENCIEKLFYKNALRVLSDV